MDWDLALKLIVYGSTACLVLMGVILTDHPITTTYARYLWYGAFIIVALLSVVASVVDSRRQDTKLTEMLTGGDNYAFIRAEIVNPKNLTDPVPLSLNASGSLFNVWYWIAPLSSKWPEPEYFSLDTARPPMAVNKGGVIIAKQLPPGKYRVEFSASNGTFVEFFTIEVIDGQLTQFIDVCRGTRKLYSFPPRRDAITCG